MITLHFLVPISVPRVRSRLAPFQFVTADMRSAVRPSADDELSFALVEI